VDTNASHQNRSQPLVLSWMGACELACCLVGPDGESHMEKCSLSIFLELMWTQGTSLSCHRFWIHVRGIDPAYMRASPPASPKPSPKARRIKRLGDVFCSRRVWGTSLPSRVPKRPPQILKVLFLARKKLFTNIQIG
jgi:hypothetical protein